MTHRALPRQVGLVGAIGIGLGSILGTGVLVSLALAARVAGTWLLPAVALGGLLALVNGLSSARLAAAHPVSGGTYEYGYRFLGPRWGFVAGWLFLAAKTASAATAALACADYATRALGLDSGRVPVAIALVVSLTLAASWGLKRSNFLNAAIVTVTVTALSAFILVLPKPVALLWEPAQLPALGTATAWVFVAYTGYGRIATMGEEVVNPQKTIPQALGITLGLAVLLYLGVGWVGLGLGLATVEPTAPLVQLAQSQNQSLLALLVSGGAIAATLGVLFNLLLGMSRVVLAMGRRADLPPVFARLDATGKSPLVALWTVAIAIIGTVLPGNVQLSWSMSAFSVLVYYGLTHWAARQLNHRTPLPYLGLAACLWLAFQVDVGVWGIGLGAIALLWFVKTLRLGKE
jgi:APA family basic amino acid/polyamine antiporter